MNRNKITTISNLDLDFIIDHDVQWDRAMEDIDEDISFLLLARLRERLLECKQKQN